MAALGFGWTLGGNSLCLKAIVKWFKFVICQIWQIVNCQLTNCLDNTQRYGFTRVWFVFIYKNMMSNFIRLQSIKIFGSTMFTVSHVIYKQGIRQKNALASTFKDAIPGILLENKLLVQCCHSKPANSSRLWHARNAWKKLLYERHEQK